MGILKKVSIKTLIQYILNEFRSRFDNFPALLEKPELIPLSFSIPCVTVTEEQEVQTVGSLSWSPEETHSGTFRG